MGMHNSSLFGKWSDLWRKALILQFCIYSINDGDTDTRSMRKPTSNRLWRMKWQQLHHLGPGLCRAGFKLKSKDEGDIYCDGQMCCLSAPTAMHRPWSPSGQFLHQNIYQGAHVLLPAQVTRCPASSANLLLQSSSCAFCKPASWT
ncbi:hypothetical protein CVIRNUC_000198 [Coccomyxa viridis]|uniref:Uncharacterized protein n=1 Tax=Coccomyxa viridis TaxID=1274662 RepID=A0AAV1HTH6_9CHLO|nr:hypothetical protein CVIRNUC_000198 [Coccomyxa viridis]